MKDDILYREFKPIQKHSSKLESTTDASYPSWPEHTQCGTVDDIFKPDAKQIL
jgi:hypothetical protein